jgi:hypothetical protein
MNGIPSLEFADGAEFSFHQYSLSRIENYVERQYRMPIAELEIGLLGPMLLGVYKSVTAGQSMDAYCAESDEDLDFMLTFASLPEEESIAVLAERVRTATVEAGRIGVCIYDDSVVDTQATAPSAFFEALSEDRKRRT